MKYRRVLAALAVAVVVIGFWTVSSSNSRGASQTFLETFDGAPSSPTPWNGSNWDVAVHTRSQETWDAMTPTMAMHGSDCGAPPATHMVNSYSGAVFQCKDHVMTTMNDGGYGAIYLTPDAMADFSGGTAVVKFDVSTLRTSMRDWIDLWVTPFNENLQLPLEDWLPDLQGPPKDAVHIRMDTWGPNADQSYFRGEIYHGFTAGETEIPKKDDMSYEQALAAHGLAPDASRRDTFELDISRTHIKFGMPQYNIWWLDADVSDLGFSQGVIQLGDHSYNPDKACDFNGTCGPDTWHWDNVSISPAAPFTIIKGNQPFVGDSSANKSVTFASPAPANARLRFSAIGKTEVSFNGGATWQLAQKQAQELNDAGHFSSYWMPIPQGTTTVQFRFSQEVDWYSGPYRARNFAVWAPGGTLSGGTSGSLQQPTATPTKTQSSGTTATPTQTMPATPTPALAPSFTTKASVAKSGRSWRVTAAVNVSVATTILADVEVYGPSGQRVAQQFWDNQALTAGVARSFTLTWTPPGGSARGTYTVKIGVFKPAWGSLFTWNDRAATFQGP